MTLREILVERAEALCERWVAAILAEYGAGTAIRWGRERDPFANPVGHALRAAVPRLYQAATGAGAPGEGAASALEDILRIRSVQEMAPSSAVRFVYRLRDVIRAELAEELAAGDHHQGLAELDARLEQLALLAFDVYVRQRETIFRLRQEELKRSVASLLRRWHGDGADEPTLDLAPPPRPAGPGDTR
jgi:hypothetical protein